MVSGFDLVHIRYARFVEHREQVDVVTLLEQPGIMPLDAAMVV